jgi:hypothetical protein
MTTPPNSGSDRGTAGDEDRAVEWRRVGQRYYDVNDDSELTVAIVYAVADVLEIDPTKVSTPLYDRVDAVALESALFGDNVPLPQGGASVEFRYEGHLVKVHRNGWIQVFEPVEAATGTTSRQDDEELTRGGGWTDARQSLRPGRQQSG